MPTDPTRPEPLTRQQIIALFPEYRHPSYRTTVPDERAADAILALLAAQTRAHEREVAELRTLLADSRSRCDAAIWDRNLWKTTSDAHASVVEADLVPLRALIGESTDPAEAFAALTADRDQRERACIETQAQLKREEQKNEKLAETNVKLNKRANEADSLRAQVSTRTEERDALQADADAARAILAPNFANRGEKETQPLASIAECAVTSHKAWFDSSEKASREAKRAWKEVDALRADEIAAAPADEECARVASAEIATLRAALAAAQGEGERQVDALSKARLVLETCRKLFGGSGMHGPGALEDDCAFALRAVDAALAPPAPGGAFGTKALDNQTQPEVE